jgi:hypothetical protein
MRNLLLAFGGVLMASTAHAQYELKSTNTNRLYQGALPVATNQATLPATVGSNLRGVSATSGSSDITSTSAYPTGGGNIVLRRSTIGGGFASGVPRYLLGDVITVPLAMANGTATPAGFWRSRPVAAGEVFTFQVTVTSSSTSSSTVVVSSKPWMLTVGSTLLGRTVSAINSNTITLSGVANQAISSATQVSFTTTPIAQGTVTVTSSSATTGTQVTVSGTLPTELAVGSTLLGQPITAVTGTSVTLAGVANQTISSATSVPVTPPTSFYYSPHAEKVFASQPGRVTVVWVSLVPNAAGAYESMLETFSVSATTAKPVRTIYWTEGSFDGPKVQITDGRITAANPIYYTAVPKAVAAEVTIPGYTPQSPNLSTFYFDKYNGIGQLHAYNVEGRIFVEYLGNVRLGGNVYDWVGYDVVQIVRAPTVTNVSVNLGKPITPHDGDLTLKAAPVLSSAQTSVPYYGTTIQPNGNTVYHAERETSAASDPDNGTPLSIDAYNKVVFYWMETGEFSIAWPKFQDRYWQRWSPNLSDYAHYSVGSEGSTAATGIAFPGGALPQVVYQDNSEQTEVQIDLATQRLFVNFTSSASRNWNRSLLKFSATSGGSVWYVNLYSQAEGRQSERNSTTSTLDGVTTVAVASTVGLEVGMVVSGPGITGLATISGFIDATHFTLSHEQPIPDGSNNWIYTVESDVALPIANEATVGTRISPPAGHENAGYISGGTGYYPAGYLDPFLVGVPAANLGAIIPVNALPSDNLLTVRWFKKISAPSGQFNDFYVPGKVGRYTVSYPASTAPQIVLAQGVGTNDLTGAEADGSVYYQNSAALPGYNPNEEHAMMLGGRAYALREDLNVTDSSGYTSEPFVLVAYTDATDRRPAIHAYKVVRTGSNNVDGRTYDFDYTATAGTLLVKPYPLPLMPLAMVGTGATRTAKDIEIIGADDPTNTTVGTDDAYKAFTFKDRKGFTWVHRGPHGPDQHLISDGYGGDWVGVVGGTTTLTVGMHVTGPGIVGTATIQEIHWDNYSIRINQGLAYGQHTLTFSAAPTLTMKLYYTSRAGFFIPGLGGSGEPPVGTILPYLRNGARSGQTLSLTAIDNGQNDEPLPIIYRPTWPTDPAELMVGETLTLPKFGLPQVRGQASAQVYYQQSIASADSSTLLSKNSVTLHDPTREKTVALDAAGVNLSALPTSIKTSLSAGKIYFQNLPPHLQQRFYMDPLRGSKGTLVFTGTFHDELAGEDYLDLNLLSQAEESLLKDLVQSGAADKDKWDAAIDGLNTRVETFKPDPAKFGTYVVDDSKSRDSGENELSTIQSPETAVDSYGLTATGQGMGFVTMVFGNGSAFTPEGDPVSVKVFKIADRLYTGDLKVITSSNPLDEQVSLRHSGDFAGKPEDYEFEWRWTTGEASAPATYTTTLATLVGNPVAATNWWVMVSDPGRLIPSAAQFAAAGESVTLPRSANVRPVTYVLDPQNQPTSTVVEPSSYTDEEIAAGYPGLFFKSSTGVDFSGGVPGSIIFSAAMEDLDGFVLYVNGKVALAHRVPASHFTSTSASTGLSELGLRKQFNLEPRFFTAGLNSIEVAVYTDADPNAFSSLDFRLDAAQETDLVDTPGSPWQTASDPEGRNTNTALIGGAVTNPFGGPQFVINDRWFTMRYRPKASAGNVLGTPYSRWMPPQFVEGWVKRVLAGINPFEQRVKDLANNAVNTDVSVLTQAGTRWEGDVALTLGNINDVGLIAIYETVLNRAKNMSIDANTNDPNTNDALILAAGYLNDLYTILGNEAYADAANPTISLDDQTSATEVNTSRFSFEGQVSSVLDEELTLLRGRNDLVSPGVSTAPFYNRLAWNYTHGINSGEVIYAINYNIKEKVGSSTANGVIDESDAQRMFPQGHGDAYGHYLTALTGYYKLLTNVNFTWTPRAETVTVLGQPVTVDFRDERKFAAAAGNLARTAEQVIALTYRQSYQDDPAAGWSSFRDTKASSEQAGAQGLDEWTSRATQGAYYHWVMANALLPDVDNYHTGVRKIDRTTVPELVELATAGATFQTTIDNANARLNPLGLSPGAIAFDISPSLMVPSSDNGGQSHFEQVYERALRSLTNANGAFTQASTMTRSLRNQQNQIDDYTTAIAQQESAFVNALIDVFGRPYSGEIGAGKLYAQGYAGPDLSHWYIVDRASDLVDTSNSFSVTVRQAVEIKNFTGNAIQDVVSGFTATGTASKTVKVQPSQLVQYNDIWIPGGLGSRAETGELQESLLGAQQSFLALSEANVRQLKSGAELQGRIDTFNALVTSHKNQLADMNSTQEAISNLNGVVIALTEISDLYDAASEDAGDFGDAVAEFFPTVSGLSIDVTSGARGAAKSAAVIAAKALKVLGVAKKLSANLTNAKIFNEEKSLESRLAGLGFAQEELQLAYELENAFRETVTHAHEFAQLAQNHQSALQRVSNVIAKGNRILADREVFRQRAAAIIQGYRTNDLGFRIFRNEALEQYRTLFDLASRYTYLAAKSYDYETGLLGSAQGSSLFGKIVASRALGDLTGGVPQSTVSSLGDAGLAGTMAKLNADFSVAKGRLGINNPDQNGTVFSLRSELFRLLNSPTTTSDDDAWRQTLEQHIVSNVMLDADVATYCRNIKKPNGTPVPGIVIAFSTTIEHSKNFFGLPLAGGDHAYSPSNFATKIYNVGLSLPGYVGMDSYASGNTNGAPTSSATNALSATPYVYLIPCGSDFMLAPPLGDTNTLRSWTVQDQALPLPYNLGATAFNSTQFFSANETLNEQPWILRKHQAFRPVADATLFYGSVPAEFTSSRLVGRSVWNNKWKIVIPAYTLLSDEQAGLNSFVATVKDVQLFLRTYSNSGN